MKDLLENIQLLKHSAIRMEKGGKIIYIDPFHLNEASHDGDIIFFTHDHHDHLSPEDVEKVSKEDTIYVMPATCAESAKSIPAQEEKLCFVEPGKAYEVEGVVFEAIPAYNMGKQFHPKENQWVGYLLHLEGNSFYIAGDTDMTPENQTLSCDVAFLPVGGTYTMTAQEAVELANKMQPKVAVPTHYGDIVGTVEDAKYFVSHVKDTISSRCM